MAFFPPAYATRSQFRDDDCRRTPSLSDDSDDIVIMSKSDTYKMDSADASDKGASSMYSRYTGFNPTGMVTINDSSLTPSPFFGKSTDNSRD